MPPSLGENPFATLLGFLLDDLERGDFSLLEIPNARSLLKAAMSDPAQRHGIVRRLEDAGQCPDTIYALVQDALTDETLPLPSPGPKQPKTAPATERGCKRQEAAIAALISCDSLEKAAKMAQVGRRTLYHWMTKDPAFQRRYLAARRQLVTHAIHHMQQASGLAVETLCAIMRDPKAHTASRVRACEIILEWSARHISLEVKVHARRYIDQDMALWTQDA